MTQPIYCSRLRPRALTDEDQRRARFRREQWLRHARGWLLLGLTGAAAVTALGWVLAYFL